MAKVNITIIEQIPDARSNELAYRVNIENIGQKTINLESISPRLPDGVRLIDVKDFSSELAKIKHRQICNHLSTLTLYKTMELSSDYRRFFVDQHQSILREVMNVSGFFRVYSDFFSYIFSKQTRERWKSRFAQLEFEINDSVDALKALNTWFQPSDGVIDVIFRAKVEQLQRLEENFGSDRGRVLAVVEPDSSAATTYVFWFPRSFLNPRKFSFAIEANISEIDSDSVQMHSASATVTVSPRPYVLTIVAMLSALLGVSLKYSLSGTAPGGLDLFLDGLLDRIFTSDGVAGVILALVVFNVYEYLQFGRDLKLSVGWRSALLVGVICGLFADRMIKALEALVGV